MVDTRDLIIGYLQDAICELISTSNMSKEASKTAIKNIRKALNEIRNDAYCCVCGEEIPITSECQSRIGVLGNIAHNKCAMGEIKYHVNSKEETNSCTD